MSEDLLDLRDTSIERMATMLLDHGPSPQRVLCALASARLPDGTVAYVAPELAPAGRPEVRGTRYLADVVWAEEPAARGTWSAYRGLCLAALASDEPWMGLATLADLRADRRLLVLGGALPAREELTLFWRGHRSRAETLHVLSWDASGGRAHRLDAEGLHELDFPPNGHEA